MPIYEFACESCGEQVEQLVKMDTETIECPACGKSMRKQISASNFHLAGHFWYKDGYGLHTDKKKNKKSGGKKKDA